MANFEEASIWRYMDLAKYVSLLQRGLFFSQPEHFSDPWEGCWADSAVRRFRVENESLTKEQIEAAWDQRFTQKIHDLQSIGVSCWHISEDESAALWQLYVPQGMGVAVRSTAKRVQRALAGAQRDVAVREMRYGLTDCSLESDARDLLSIKRRSFEHERELRFFVSIREDDGAQSRVAGFKRGSSACVTSALVRPER